MIRLNLLPEKIRARERLMLIVALGILVYVLALLGLGWLWAMDVARVRAVRAEAAAIQRQLDSPELREAVQAVERYTRDKNEKNEKASVVNALRKRQATLVRLLDSLPDWTLNGEIWITRLEAKEGKGGNPAVLLAGTATSALAFAHFFTNLDSQPLVSGLKISTAPRVEKNGQRELVSFQVSFDLEAYP
jgi:hypothetical protein